MWLLSFSLKISKKMMMIVKENSIYLGLTEWDLNTMLIRAY